MPTSSPGRALDLDVLHVGQLLELSNSPHQPLGGRGERGADADEPPAANGLRHALQFELAYELELEAALRQSTLLSLTYTSPGARQTRAAGR